MKKKLILEEHIIAGTLLIMLSIQGINVFCRYITGWSFSFSEELVVYLFAVSSFIGASAACARGANMGLSALVDLCPPNIQKVFILLSAIGSILLFALLFKRGIEAVRMMLKYGQRTPILRWPTWMFEIAYPIGAVLYIFRTIQFTVRKLKEVA